MTKNTNMYQIPIDKCKNSNSLKLTDKSSFRNKDLIETFLFQNAKISKPFLTP